MICPFCNGSNTNVQVVAEREPRSAGSAFLVILASLFTFGIVLMLVLLTGNKTVTKSYLVCQDCGSMLNLKSYDDLDVE